MNDTTRDTPAPSSLKPIKRQPYTPPILETHGVWQIVTGGSAFEIQAYLPDIPKPGV